MSDYVVVEEGLARLKVPNPSLYRDERGRFEPAWAPVFFNPRMRLSRDVGSVLVKAYALYSGRSRLRILDALAATGARGIRYAVENREYVGSLVLNDLNPLAARIAEENVRLNGLEEVAQVRNMDASRLMLEEGGFDIVEIDPFGTPAPFVDPALRAVSHNGMLCVTATDMPPLLGHYPYTSLRKYFSWSLRTEFSRETGARILLYFTAREAAKLGKRVYPLYTQSSDHYIRVCVKVENREAEAGGLKGNVGYVEYCPRGLHRRMAVGVVPLLRERCPVCGVKLLYAGPLWVGSLWDRDFAVLVARIYGQELSRRRLSRRGEKVTRLIASEVDAPPLYYTTDSLASKYGLAREPSAAKLVEKLSESGFPASLTHFDSKGFRSSLPPEKLAGVARAMG